MADIQPPSPIEPIINDRLSMLQRFRNWTQLVSSAINFLQMAEGTGSPETVLASDANKFYRDTAAPALYWKSVDDVAGDNTKGWVLVV